MKSCLFDTTWRHAFAYNIHACALALFHSYDAPPLSLDLVILPLGSQTFLWMDYHRYNNIPIKNSHVGTIINRLWRHAWKDISQITRIVYKIAVVCAPCVETGACVGPFFCLSGKKCTFHSRETYNRTYIRQISC